MQLCVLPILFPSPSLLFFFSNRSVYGLWRRRGISCLQKKHLLQTQNIKEANSVLYNGAVVLFQLHQANSNATEELEAESRNSSLAHADFGIGNYKLLSPGCWFLCICCYSRASFAFTRPSGGHESDIGGSVTKCPFSKVIMY